MESDIALVHYVYEGRLALIMMELSVLWEFSLASQVESARDAYQTIDNTLCPIRTTPL